MISTFYILVMGTIPLILTLIRIDMMWTGFESHNSHIVPDVAAVID